MEIFIRFFFFLENLKNYFTQFGEVLECMIMKDAITKRSRYFILLEYFYQLIIISFCLLSRGFGFITYKDANSVDKVLAKDVHMLDEKQVCILNISLIRMRS
jgi:RNA recognition motif-containing protein